MRMNLRQLGGRELASRRVIMTIALLLVACLIQFQTTVCLAQRDFHHASSFKSANQTQLSQSGRSSSHHNGPDTGQTQTSLAHSATTTSVPLSSTPEVGPISATTAASSTTPVTSDSDSTSSPSSNSSTSAPTQMSPPKSTTVSNSSVTSPNSENLVVFSAPKNSQDSTKQHKIRQQGSRVAATKLPKVSGSGKQFASSIPSAPKASDNRQQQQLQLSDALGQAARDPIDQMSTSQSVSFAEPATNQPEQQTSSSNANRWTHFGARLRPLTKVSATDHHKSAGKHHNNAFNVAAEQREQVMVVQRSPSQQQSRRQQPQLSGNQLTSASGADESPEEDPADQDDEDNEALLYKMMQQQGLLTSSMWQKPQVALVADSGKAGGEPADSGKAGGEPADQVDDSDDQIRGTYTRLRPTSHLQQASGNPQSASARNSWQQSSRLQSESQPRRQHHNGAGDNQYSRNRPNVKQPRQDQHIFVSTQPLATARANFNEPEPHVEPKSLNHLSSESGSGGTNEDGDSSPLSPSSSETANDADDNAPPGEAEDDFECPNNGIFADEPSGCQAYHVCQAGAQVQQKFQCPLGTLFNNIILTCDFAHNVQCGSAKSKPVGQSDQFASQDQVRQSQPVQQQHQQQHQHLQQQQQQASVQVNQGSQSPVYKSQAQHRQPQRQQQAAGPRHLKIGSQYIPRQQIQHQQHQTVTAQAVNVYPPAPKSISSNDVADGSTDSAGNSADDSDDNEPVEPLVPATLPPRSSPPALPYNPPPSAQMIDQAAQKAQQQQQQQQSRQTAHRSQYPHPHQISGGQNSHLTNYVQPAYFGGHNEPASSANPAVFVGSQDQPADNRATSGVAGADRQSFNLVINHGAPTRPTQPVKPNADKSHRQTGKKSNSLAGKQEVRPNLSTSQKINHHQRALSPTRGDTSRQSASATQPSVYHTEASTNNPTAPRGNNQRIALVDLTNNNDDRLSGASGISADALNDGMLLVVRHGGGGGGGETTSSFHLGSAHQDLSQQDYGKPNERKMLAGQAFALDPSIVRPNSPVDAQLFPNVQRVLSRAPHPEASSQFVQHADRQSPGAAALINQPLPRLEPPRPNLNPHQGRTENQSTRQLSEQHSQVNRSIHQQQSQYQGDQLKSSASAAPAATSRPTTTTTTTTTSTTTTTGKRPTQEQKVGSKRSKRLKAVSSPTSERPPATSTPEVVDVVTAATSGPIVSAKSNQPTNRLQSISKRTHN